MLMTIVSLGRELLAVGLEEGAHALRPGLLRAGEEDVDAEVLEVGQALREPEDDADAGRVVVLALGGGGEGDVEQERDVDDQRDGRRGTGRR